MAGEIISESVGGIIPERRAASPGIGTDKPVREAFKRARCLTPASGYAPDAVRHSR
jgi:hypothetical protein